MSTPPQSAWDRDPEGTYRKIMSEIDKDERNGYIYKAEASLLRKAAAKCYLRGKRNREV